MPEEQVDVLGLADGSGGQGAEDRRVAALGQRAPDDVGEGGEDRILELGQHQPDEPAAVAAQLGRPFVAEDVERDEDRLAGRIGDPGLRVQDAADGGLADTGLLGDIRQAL